MSAGVHIDAFVLVVLGAILGISVIADVLAARLRLPRISLLVLLGVAFGVLRPFALDADVSQQLDIFAEPLIVIALVMVAFLLGGELTYERMKDSGRLILTMSLTVVTASVAIVGTGLVWLGFPLAVALPLAAISAATDPAAVREVVRESRRVNVQQSQLLLGIVAIDDAWGIIAFGVMMSMLDLLTTGNGMGSIGHTTFELLGAIALGLAIGVPGAVVTGRLRPGQPTQVEAIALVLLIAGASQRLGVSPLLTAMVVGVTVANLSAHHTRSFREIEHIEWPFLVVFFCACWCALGVRSCSQRARTHVGVCPLTPAWSMDWWHRWRADFWRSARCDSELHWISPDAASRHCAGNGLTRSRAIPRNGPGSGRCHHQCHRLV